MDNHRLAAIMDVLDDHSPCHDFGVPGMGADNHQDFRSARHAYLRACRVPNLMECQDEPLVIYHQLTLL
jgi:hypothetical protein